MSPEQRKAIDNGIWLCATHADQVDDDEITYTGDILRELKRRHEAYIKEAHDRGLPFGKGTDGHRGDDLILFEFWATQLDLPSLAWHMYTRPEHSFNVVISEDFIQRVIGFLEQADSFLLFRSPCYEMRFSIQQFIRAARDFVTLIDEAEPEPSKTKYANIFWEHQNRGEFLYLVDTMRDCEWGLQTSVRISFEKAVLRRVMFSMIITANGVIHSANGIGLYKEPYRYISTDDGVPFITEQPYPGLEQNRQNLLPHFRSL